MSGERAPLISSVGVGPPVRRYPHNVVRRFCTIALSSTLIWCFGVMVLNAILGRDVPYGHRPDRPDDGWSWPGHKDRRLSYEQLRDILRDEPSSELAEEWSRYYTDGAHLAGQNLSQALWTKDKWESWGIKSSIVSYDVYLNYPVDHRLALLEEPKKSKGTSDPPSWKVSFEASLTEDVIDEDPTTSRNDSIPTFHGYSASGNVTASYVYVNYGTYQDFEDLLRANVSLKGNIAIARYGGIFRGLKVKRAQELGMVAAVLYSDPGDDGEDSDYTDPNDTESASKSDKPYPEGPRRHPSSVQRGSAQFLSIAPGDPTTPGYPSKPGVPRQDPHGLIASIPSLPISYTDALPILKALNGNGPSSEELGSSWARNRGLRSKGVKYDIGPSPAGVALNVYNEQKYVTTPLWNVIGVINGSIPDEVIVVGNHRDAWIVGGAGDPNSGSAVINEVIRSFGKALEAGWKPLRTIVFASWDGEEYSLIGSTEWVEEHLPWLSATSVAYLNVDVAVSGPQFKAAGAPLLDALLHEITGEVQSPNQTVKGQTVRDVWGGSIDIIGSGSDFTAFQDYAGIPSLDISFIASASSPVYHYHSNYDSFHWMAKFGDPGFVYHRTMAQILGLLTAKLADKPVISFVATDYAEALASYVDKVERKLDSVMSPHPPQPHKPLGTLKRRADEDLPWWKWPAKLKLALEIRALNTRLKFVERHFIHQPGLDGRNWYKSVVFAPGLWTGYAGAVFPGLQESIDSRDFENAVRWVGIIEDCILKAADGLDLGKYHHHWQLVV
ncbi:N-acetylated-alpha-linked acidic dipeptidase 2 [Magnaporthiopsis poae ATCC 64411]|uniref:N-acetylated-alpha-linked acidic dipeptidase 2 n=1 Tax=Magnaporthiopsis poae (strain ATCC 64411 / 73-15) TaxID=644358 RepID=A0A0C4E3Q3_MAGP6|nr:N-acetylated-alpha-linked acidic dipeptidase 2 [Magnaporthiopsis poae ATCC 64411]